jgi:Co/Zn/Cd efflux system component
MEGVVAVSQARVWQISHGQSMGSIKVQVRPEIHEQEIKKKIIYLFYNQGLKDIVVQIDKDVVAF